MAFFTTGAQLQAAINALPASKKGGFIAFDPFFYGQEYMSAGKYAGSLTPIEHFVQIGAAQGNKPSAAFDPVFYASKYADLNNKGFDSADLLFHFLRFGLDEGRVPNATLEDFDGAAYLLAYPDVAAFVNANLAQFGGSATNGALAHYVKFGQFDGHVIAASAVSSSLTIGVDNLTGTATNDTFNANFADNRNTFQSGDVIKGGAGAADVLNADLGTSSNFAILASTSGIEQVFFRAQSTNANGSSGNNNVDTTGQKATVDAEKMVGVTQWWNTDSRADLKIEDVRILDGQITKDITIGLRNTDAGSMGFTDQRGGNKVDFEVYFSPESLRDRTTNVANNTLVLEIMDVKGAQLIAQPLLNLPLEGFTARLTDGSALVIGATGSPASIAINNAASYGELVVALNAAVAANPLAAGKLTFTLGNTFVATSSATGESYTGTGNQIIVTLNNAATPTVGFQTSVGPYGEVVSVSSFEFVANETFSEFRINKQFIGGASNTTELITSTIILDNVGREDEAGTLKIGSMSTHGGVERFEITVENNADNAYAGTQSGSWLGHMSSTNNTLQEVKVVNAAAGIANPDYLYLGTNIDQAGNNLDVMQDWPGGLDRTYRAITAVTTSLLNTDGLTDVRLFDASAMTGQVFVGANITDNTIRKYQNLVDTAAAHGADDVAFEYKTGAANDSINLAIDGDVTASNSNVVVGRHDFSFLVDGGAGNDNIQVKLVSNSLSGGADNWYNNQAINNNVTVNGGAGNDTIRKPGAGNVNINGGAGDDTIYADNTGSQPAPLFQTQFNLGRAVYVFNAADGDAGTAGNQYNVFDLESQAAATVSAVNANLTVTFKGITKTVVIGDSAGKLSNVAISDLTVNQAIKDAINNDAVLSKLLLAQDGPGRTLGVRSLIDGADVGPADLGIAFGTTGPLTPAQVTAAVTLFTTTSNAVTDGYLTTNFGQYAGGAAAAAAVAETFVATFGATVDADSVTFDATPAVVLGAAQTGIQNAAAYATAYNANVGKTWTAVNTAGQATVTFTKNVAGPVTDATTADFVVTSGGAGADVTVTAAPPTTQGAAAVVAANEMIGADSTSTSDNIITGGTGNDVIVLGTTSGATSLLASNDTVKYSAGSFGNDTVVNFGVNSAIVAAATEVFVATFGATVDADSVTFDGTPAVVLAAAQTGIQNAAAYATAYNANAGKTWTAANVAGQATVTFTKNVAGAFTDIATANFVVTSGGAGADVTVTAAAPTTQGVTGVTAINSDIFDFTALGGDLTATFSNFNSFSADKSIVVAFETLATDTELEVAALFADSATAMTHVYVAYDANNIGKVYTVTDPAGTGALNVMASLVGTIDLAATGWGTLTGANFV